MRPLFQTAFDLTQHSDLIRPAYWFIAIFVFAGAVLLILAWIAIRLRWRSRRSLPIFAAVWTALCTHGIIEEVRDVAAVRYAVEHGDVETVEGCLDYFRPGAPQGTKSIAGNEQWRVAGRVFDYGAGEVRPAFHHVSTAGGPVRPDSRVRVTYVQGSKWGRREIVKLEIAPGACTPARHVEAFDQP